MSSHPSSTTSARPSSAESSLTYLDGQSFASIAKLLNADAVPPPRVHARNRREGWKDSTIRAILHNESYIGRWRYKTKQGRKFPGTNRRLPIRRDEADVIAREYPERRIIDQETWEAVQARLRAVSAHYTKTKDGKAKGRSVPGRSSAYLFSSLLFCGACGGKMVISGGSGAHRHYRCEGHSKRGVCENDLSVREGVVRASLLDELRQRLASTDGVIYARKRIAERLGQIDREQSAEVKERRARLDKFDRQIEKLVAFVAEGHGSQAVADKLRILEREATTERKTLAAPSGIAQKRPKMIT